MTYGLEKIIIILSKSTIISSKTCQRAALSSVQMFKNTIIVSGRIIFKKKRSTAQHSD
jgi:hypothetical protein